MKIQWLRPWLLMLRDYLKEAVMSKYLLLGLLGCFGMMPMGNALAKELWSPITAAEVQVLPPYCKEKITGVSDGINYASQYVGGWADLHHYCYALNNINRYYGTFDQNARRFYLNGVLGDFQYLFSHTAPDFWLRPEMHTQKGKLLVSAKRGGEAAAEFLMAIQENKNYAPAYVALSDFYRNLGQKPKALSTVEDGLKYAPDDRVLVSRYRELTGHAFVPPAVSATPSEGKASGVKTDANTAIQPAVSIPAPASEGTVAPVATQPAPAAEDSPKIGSPTNPYCRFCP